MSPDVGNMGNCNLMINLSGLEDDENRRNFILLRTASMLNVTNIYAGGHHSWLLTDTISPERMDYETPSPLDSGNFTPTLNRSGNVTPKGHNTSKIELPKQEDNVDTVNKAKGVNSNIKFNIEAMLTDRSYNPSICLQVAYTDLQMSHRFVRFSIKKHKDSVSFKELNTMINQYVKTDNGIIMFRLQDDNEVLSSPLSNFPNPALDNLLKEVKTSFKLFDKNSIQRSFSLTMIYDYERNKEFKKIKGNIEYLKHGREDNLCKD